MDLGAPCGVRQYGSKRSCRHGLNPPCPAARVNDDPLTRASTSHPSCDGIDLFAATLCRGGNFCELDGGQRVCTMGLTTVQDQTSCKRCDDSCERPYDLPTHCA